MSSVSDIDCILKIVVSVLVSDNCKEFGGYVASPYFSDPMQVKIAWRYHLPNMTWKRSGGGGVLVITFYYPTETSRQTTSFSVLIDGHLYLKTRNPFHNYVLFKGDVY